MTEAESPEAPRSVKKQLAAAVLVVAGVAAIVPLALSGGNDGEPIATSGGEQMICHFVEAAPFDYFELIITDAEGAKAHFDDHGRDFYVGDAAACRNMPVLVCAFANGGYTVVETDPVDANNRLLNSNDLLAVDATCPDNPPAEPAEPAVGDGSGADGSGDASQPSSAAEPAGTDSSADGEVDAPGDTSAETGAEDAPDAGTSPAADAEVLGTTTELADTGFGRSDLAAVGLTLVAIGLVMLWRGEERTARLL